MRSSKKPPIFPKFEKVEIAHKEFIDTYNKLFEPYSDFNFTSLFSWSDDQAEVSLLNKNLVLKMPDYLDGTPTYSVLGKNKVDETLLELFAIAKKLRYVPEVTVNSIRDQNVFHITEDEDNFDYIYLTSSLSSLQGGQYKKIRSKVHAFEQDHVNHEVSTYTISRFPKELINEIKKIDLLWAISSDREDGDLISERKALATLLDNADSLNLLLTCLLVNNELKAFSINELLDKNYAICHFEKALKSHHANITPFLVSTVAKKIHEAGVTHLNWEQDLGLPGLRHSKLAYQPTKMLKKYTVKPRSSEL